MNILLLGDSWANEFLRGVIASSTGCTTYLSRHQGLTSQEIYEKVRSTNPNADIVVILAGVNDAARHVGAGAYALGMSNLVAWAQDFGSCVHALELPPILLAPESWHAFVLRWWNDAGKRDVVQSYREAWRWSVIPFPALSLKYWANETHLNDEGKLLLAQAIVDVVMRERANAVLRETGR